MSESHCRIRAGLARAGASTGRGEVRLRHTVATETATHALLPMDRGGGVPRAAAAAATIGRVVGVDDERDAPGDAAAHDTSRAAAVTAQTYSPILLVTSPASVSVGARLRDEGHDGPRHPARVLRDLP